MQKGKYTGQGGKYEPAGIVHKGEYVIPKEGVNQKTGLPKPSFIRYLGDPNAVNKLSDVDESYSEYLDEQKSDEEKAIERKKKLEFLRRINQERLGFARGGYYLKNISAGLNGYKAKERPLYEKPKINSLDFLDDPEAYKAYIEAEKKRAEARLKRKEEWAKLSGKDRGGIING